MGRNKVRDGLKVITSLYPESIKNWHPKRSMTVIRSIFVVIFDS